MTTVKIRACALKPDDVILGEKDGHRYRLIVQQVNPRRDFIPKQVDLILKDGGRLIHASAPWDRRHTVERSGGPSEALEPRVGAETPTRPRPALPEPSGRAASLIAEAREEFIAKVRKIIRDNP